MYRAERQDASLEDNVCDFSVHCYTQAEYEECFRRPSIRHPLGRCCYSSDTTTAEDTPGT